MWPLSHHVSLLLLLSAEFGLLHASASLDVEQRATSEFYAPLKSRASGGGKSLIKRSGIPYYGTARATHPYGGNWWAEAQIGNQTLTMFLDTGSSDSWILLEGFRCTNGTDEKPPSYCGAGPYFKGTTTGGPVADEHFNITYFSGEHLIGEVGYEDITIAGFTVPHQKMGLINDAYWPAGSAGMLGLAWTTHKKAVYPGKNLTNEDANGDPAHAYKPYSSFFNTMITEGLVPPVFSLALARVGTDESYIAFGGLPPVEVEGKLVSTPMLLEQQQYNDTVYHHYNIKVDAMTYQSYTNASAPASGNGSMTAIVDCGSIAIDATPEVVAAYAKLFNPPARFVPELDIYIMDCDTQPPKEPFQVIINGTTFLVPGSAFVLNQVILKENGYEGEYGDYCFSGIQEETSFGYLLGTPFLEHVVAVHDIGAAEMRFAQRLYNGTV